MFLRTAVSYRLSAIRQEPLVTVSYLSEFRILGVGGSNEIGNRHKHLTDN